ncbi:Putative aromatic amino acid lyase, L-Aspartase, phenylalanine/histidine ammonia-lyase, active [Colletotrichum destructivum]|uniref:Aromatic amino acid lyase, L-Aspartase, phenylalanine/histidine ammonia-lyase, active n=1 Tax=Colletotrichum destructivum TaxID=34406 RepID=A0AAX4ISE3_9PEZI|nr:Putative aromatic amino acid lyase, L-Aspartase, phenylalanine/histidine ammonia-lyase, active [Colletotrichum destructivum]
MRMPKGLESSHASALRDQLEKLRELQYPGADLALDGDSLDVATVVAVARHGLTPHVKNDPEIQKRILQSIRVLDHHIDSGWVVYGVNTGFGGSADSRTEQLKKLQISLLQHTQSAIITASDLARGQVDQDGQSHVIPSAWVKAAMVVRANQNLRGHSAVRIAVVETLLSLIQHDITPMVPLRGTISASGDLMPLSYIAGTLVGDPNISVTVGSGDDRKVMPACDALKQCGIQPVELQPKEGLGLINGTAPSAALASLVIHEANQLAVIAQALTAFTADCLLGNVEWANEFIHRIRPHTGQVEAARNIRSFLQSSSFVVGLDTKKRTGQGLWQDRYSTRTAPQWIGPYLEDLALAQRQVEVELNSTSDNPVIDIGIHNDHAAGEIYSGGNFQATAITSAMDKTRTALQMIGRMLFSQCSELINPATNNGLDPNLVFGDPDESYTMKGIDVNMGAYMSELASLAHPVSSHIQSAEMHNQGINSLAFLSGRRTMEAVDVLSHMCAAHLFVCCQAADLRDYHERFLSSTSMSAILNGNKLGLSSVHLTKLTFGLDDLIRSWWYEANKLSHVRRCSFVASKVTSHVMDLVMHGTIDFVSVKSVLDVQEKLRQSMEAWLEDPSNNPTTKESTSVDIDAVHLEGLGQGSALLFGIVRGKLGLPFHQGLREVQSSTIGRSVSQIYEAIRQGVVVPVLMPCLEADGQSLSAREGTPASSDASTGSVNGTGSV